MSNIQKQHKISPAIAWLTIQKFIIFYCPLDGEHTMVHLRGVFAFQNILLYFYTLNRYPTPHIVSIYCGLDVSTSTFSRIFLICTVTVAISPMDSISQILENSSSLVNTWLGFWARKVRRSNSLVVKFFSSPFT